MRTAIGRIARVAIAVVVIFAVLIGIGAAVGPGISTTGQNTSLTQTQASSSVSQDTAQSQTTSSTAFTSMTTSSQNGVTSSGQTATTSSSSVASTAITTSPGTTLQELIAGKFPTATDKQGTNGVTVAVHGLLVLSVRTESDGDWHVAVTDGKVPVFITEITPSYQASLGKPTVGSTIDETGIAYCDTVHQTQSWHGDTCWEIHPVTAWQPSATSSTATTTSQTYASELNASISYARNPISRGSTQTIMVRVSDADGAVSNAAVSVHIDYASGSTAKDFNCTTATDGSCSVAWLIGGTSNTGTFNVKVLIEGVAFYSSFQVTTAAGG